MGRCGCGSALVGFFTHVPETPRGQLLLRTLSFIVGAGVLLICGVMYAFPAYSVVLKTNMGFSGKAVNFIYSMGIMAQLTSFVSGWLADNLGPALALLWGASWVSVGFLCVWLQYMTRFSYSPILMGIFYFISVHGSGTFYLTSLNINVRNFHARHKTIVTGVLVMFMGLSGALYGAIYQHFFAKTNNMAGFLTIFFTLLPALGFIGVLCVRRVPPTVKAAPTLVVEESRPGDPTDSVNSRLIHPGNNPGSFGIRKVEETEGITGLKLFKNLDYILMFVSTSFSLGTALIFIGNLSLIFKANSIDSSLMLIFIQIGSYTNCFGRPFMAAISAFCLQSRFPKVRAILNLPFWILFCVVVMLLTHIGLIYQGPFAYAAGFLMPFGYGGMYAVLPACVCAKFGEKHFGFNFGVMLAAVSIGNICFSQVSGALYDVFANSSGECYGRSCFMWSFVFCTALSSISLLCIATVWLRETRRLLGGRSSLVV